MKALVYEEPEAFSVREIPIPRGERHEVLRDERMLRVMSENERGIVDPSPDKADSPSNSTTTDWWTMLWSGVSRQQSRDAR